MDFNEVIQVVEIVILLAIVIVFSVIGFKEIFKENNGNS